MLSFLIICNECGIEFAGTEDLLCSCPECNSFDCEIVETFERETREEREELYE